MKAFLDQDFLLLSETAKKLYHDYAKSLPIIDYHNHLIPEQIAKNTKFENLSQVWLYGDHYKWRAMRTHGIPEQYITGDASDREKFRKWAETVPYTMRNPLYHWTHLELQRYFGITEQLNADSADRIYDQTTEQLKDASHSVHGLLNRMNVEIVCTTDDPLDNLAYHQAFAQEGQSFRMLPAFRPDKAMQAEDVDSLNAYIDRLALVVDRPIGDLNAYLDALKSRHDYFAKHGGTISDHGLEQIYVSDYTEAEIANIFLKIRQRLQLTTEEVLKFKSAMLVYFAQWDHEKGWVQQYHLGALRNNNARMLKQNGPDTGWDSIGDFVQGKALSAFFNKLDSNNQLAKTIIYNLNPADNELFATMIGNFNDGSVRGKMQFGSAWWFLDQKDGMTKQINALSNMGLLSCMVGMLTDSRSFLSFPRHEYFRRLLCSIFAEDIENGELPNDLPWVGKLVSDICYYNAKEYFNF